MWENGIKQFITHDLGLINMANIIENRMELSFTDDEARLTWFSANTSRRGDQILLKYKEAWSGVDCCSRILDNEETDDGATLLYFDSRWSSPCTWFSEMVQANPDITEGCLSFSDPNMLAIGELEWNGSDLTESYREGEDLSADDLFVLGVEACDTYSELV